MNRAPRHSLPDSVMMSPAVTALCGVGALLASVLTGYAPLTSLGLWTLIAVLMIVMNRHFFSQLRVTPIYASLFLMLQVAMPQAPAAQQVQGAVFALAAMGGMAALYSCYSRPENTTTLYLPFLMAGVGAMFQPAYLLLAVMFLIGAIQVAAFSPRGLLAALLGLVAGPALLWGMALVPFHWPGMIQFVLPHPARDLHPGISVIASTVLCCAFGVACSLMAYGYPAKLRAFNGVIYTLSVFASAMSLLNLVDCALYMPLLNACAAYHVSHFAATRSGGWPAIAATVAGSAGLFIWNL